MTPRIGAWLVSLFAPAQQAEAITGDMQEEFSQIAAASGLARARRWYWREALRTAVHLAAAAITAAPWSTAAAVIAGFLLIRYAGTLPEKGLMALIGNQHFFDNHFDAYRFLSYYGLLICHVVTMLAIGAIVALFANKREMVATLILALVQTTLALVGFFVVIAMSGRWEGMPLGWMLAFPAATIAGGIAVRSRRMKLYRV